MKKRDMLLDWAKDQNWFYLPDVPYQSFGMSRQTASTALIDFCRQGKMDFRVVGIKQYKAKGSDT